MLIDYNSISAENTVKYGTDIKRIGGMLLADRYDDRTHFIFELLQNAEDALAKRGTFWEGERSVTFSLSSSELTVSHFGKPFDEADVRGVCGIGESTKEELTDIGRFGIGFKSVYAFTDSPEIHSGDEHFAIDDYVHPKQVDGLCLKPNETVIRIPFRKDEPDAKDKILNGLRNLSTRTLLFLRQIEEIHWNDSDGGVSGLYLRGRPESIGNIARKVALIGQDNENREIEEDYIVFSREVFDKDTSVGFVEVAFALRINDSDEELEIHPATNTELVAFFPTVLSTNLGFVMQGPYRTTPSRDNVPEADDWNRHLVEETSHLLVDALRELKDLGLLNVSALETLPLDEMSSRFSPLFKAVRDALRTEQLLPTYTDGYVAARDAALARGRGLRDLISSTQLTKLYESDEDMLWLSAEITENRTPQLYEYLIDTFDVGQVTPTDLIRRLDRTFLEEQPDEWIEGLYEFLNEQRALRIWMSEVPLVRLENGAHVVAQVGDEPQAYLPTENKTDFPIVRTSVCQSDDALEFLKYLGLRKPDLVDDVIEHVLPKYSDEQVDVHDDDYRLHVSRIVTAYGTDSREQRDRLVSALQEARFVASVDAGTGSKRFVRPHEVYQATEALKALFEGVKGVKLVNDSRDELRGSAIANVIQSAGTPNVLDRIKVPCFLTEEQKIDMRRKSGEIGNTGRDSLEDYTLMGLDNLLDFLSGLPAGEASERTKLLWDALQALERSRSIEYFKANYRWFYYRRREATFQSQFVRMLNERAWVPDENGALRQPGAVTFSDTGWTENPNLQSEIRFVPDVVTELAEAMGIEPEAVSFLKQNGITLDQLKERFTEPDKETGDQFNEPDSTTADESNDPSSDEQNDHENNTGEKDEDAADHDPSEDNKNDSPTPSPQDSKPLIPRRFISYVEVGKDDTEDEELDDLTHEERMTLESQAIAFILSKEPTLQTTPMNNPGFDLFEQDNLNTTVRWVEVKSMKGSLDDRSATLTRTQFEFAQQKQDDYWLYVVENTGTPEANIVRIQNPAGKAKTFTFDRGWRNAAEMLEPPV